jgi:NTP pyrophosphatase (non-canonical NTP hydrolase)
VAVTRRLVGLTESIEPLPIGEQRRQELMRNIVDELERAYKKHGRDQWGRHEFYAILKEEVDELWDAIKKDATADVVFDELVQVAAMCFRYFETGDRYREPELALAAPSVPATRWRPEVQAFADAMEAKLRKHDATRGPTGWRTDNSLDLIARLREEVHEFLGALNPAAPPQADVLGEAADVANFAMMLADVTGNLVGPATREPR